MDVKLWLLITKLQMQLNRGRFRDNGQCGYLLRPPFFQPEAETEAAMKVLSPAARKKAEKKLSLKHKEVWVPPIDCATYFNKSQYGRGALELSIRIICARHLPPPEKEGLAEEAWGCF